MPQRAIGIVVAVTGLLFVMGLILLRFNLRKAARTGPKWKRNLIITGIFVLSSLGLVATTSSGVGCVTMCYEPAPLPARRSMQSLSDRLDLLEEFALYTDKLEPTVVKEVLAGIEQHIAILEKEEYLAELNEEERANLAKLREKVKAHVKKIRAKLKGEE